MRKKRIRDRSRDKLFSISNADKISKQVDQNGLAKFWQTAKNNFQVKRTIRMIKVFLANVLKNLTFCQKMVTN